MPRKYKRVSDRGKYGQTALTAALDAIKSGCSLKKAERDFGVPRKTLRRHRDGKVLSPGTAHLGGCNTVLHFEFERQLVAHIQTMQGALFGLTTVDVRKLAFQLADKLHLNHRFNTSRKTAGLDWLSGFLSRHAELSIRSPQGTSLIRAVGFNRPKVNQFF
jgi:helix-turn-helix, Psq domain